MPRKDPDCPNCGGRSYDASGGDNSYHVCQLCEEPDERFVEMYKKKWPHVYENWKRPRLSYESFRDQMRELLSDDLPEARIRELWDGARDAGRRAGWYSRMDQTR